MKGSAESLPLRECATSSGKRAFGSGPEPQGTAQRETANRALYDERVSNRRAVRGVAGMDRENRS